MGGLGAEPRALRSAGIPWKGWGQEGGRLQGLVGKLGSRKGWDVPSRVNLSVHWSLGEGRNTSIPTTFIRGSQVPPLPITHPGWDSETPCTFL